MNKCQHINAVVKRMCNNSGGVLPSGYQQLDYIQGTGTQVLNLVFVPNVTCRFEIKFNIQSGYSNPYPFIFGSFTANSPTTNNYFFQYYTENGHESRNHNKCNVINGINNVDVNGVLTSTVNYNTDYTAKYTENSVYLNDTLQGVLTPNASMATTYNAYLFTAGSSGGYLTNQCSKMKAYYLKVWQDGELIRNLVPALRKTDSKPGMYDTVTKTFFVNQGTGEFSYG